MMRAPAFSAARASPATTFPGSTTPPSYRVHQSAVPLRSPQGSRLHPTGKNPRVAGPSRGERLLARTVRLARFDAVETDSGDGHRATLALAAQNDRLVLPSAVLYRGPSVLVGPATRFERPCFRRGPRAGASHDRLAVWEARSGTLSGLRRAEFVPLRCAQRRGR